MEGQKYFIIVRLFKGWKDQIMLYPTCVQTYWSMRVEVRQMGSFLSEDEDYIRWNLLHQGYPLDTLQNSSIEEIYENLPFDVLIKKDLSREEVIELKERLHKAIYADEISDDEIGPDNYEPTYESWMKEYQDALSELSPINVPNKDFNIYSTTN